MLGQDVVLTYIQSLTTFDDLRFEEQFPWDDERLLGCPGLSLGNKRDIKS